MGRIIVEQIVTVDGFAADRGGSIDFFEGDERLREMEDDQLAMLAHVDAIVLGGNTYRMFAKFWPDANPEKEKVAAFINSKPKHVFSRKLEKAPWGNHEPAIIEIDAVERVLPELRKRYEGDIIVWGSLAISETMFRENLVDVVRLRSVPVLMGGGKSVTPNELSLTKVKLESCKAYPSGCVVQTYLLK
ncbi:MAG: dihydrofolate reductase family protein [Kofleriaceae bacterium]